MSAPIPQPGILGITPYKGGDSSVPGVSEVHKLSSNESPLGPSPRAIAAYRNLAGELHRYPDGASADLRQTLGEHYGLDPERIVCSNGSDEMIGLLMAAYAGVGDEIVYSQHGFLMYPIAAKVHGVTAVAAPEKNLSTDVDALLAAVTPKTKIVFLANPNNPTGTYTPASEVKRLRDGLPADVLLVIDAAYAEYVTRNDYSAGAELVDAGENTVMTRTFSKIHGLAALRVGWTYAPASIAGVLNRVRGPFNVNAPAQAAAVAALQDAAHVEAARQHNDLWLPKLTEGIKALGLEVPPSVGNFILIRFGEAPKDAAAANAFLTGRGLILRGVAPYGLGDCLRMTIGTKDENLKVLAALKDFVSA